MEMKKIILLALTGTLSTCGSSSHSRLAFAEVDCQLSYANQVIKADGASGKGFADPQKSANGVRGAGDHEGSLDVFSLDKTTDGSLILAWGGRTVCNRSGSDLNVFENAFINAANGSLFFEPIIVSVSVDGQHFVDFPHDYTGSDQVMDVANIGNWQGFAGLNPSYYHEENNNYLEHGVDPLDETLAGGNAFDLDNLSDDVLSVEIKQQGFRFVKLTAPNAVGFPGFKAGYADIDGVYARVHP